VKNGIVKIHLALTKCHIQQFVCNTNMTLKNVLEMRNYKDIEYKKKIGKERFV
jgi:hypothetical protein